VVAELKRRGFVPVAVARDTGKLAASGFQDLGVEVRTASIDDPASLDRSFADALAVINCAGPFLDTADAVVAASLRSRIHYLDVTAEQASAQATFDKFGALAREAGVVIIPAMGFYGGLSDLLATAAMGDWDFADEIRIGIALDSWRPTEGTRLTGRRNTAPRLVVAEGRLTPLVQPAPDTVWDFPNPFGRQDVAEIPFSEIIVIAQHLRMSHLHTYLNLAPLRDLRDPATPPPVAADATGRSTQTFLVEVIVRKGRDTRTATARGRDIYAFTAPLVCEAVQRILEGAARSSGAHAPGALFDARGFMEALSPEPLAFQISSESRLA
jgi:Saccharopine dehydrogenase NADP binding domain